MCQTVIKDVLTLVALACGGLFAYGLLLAIVLIKNVTYTVNDWEERSAFGEYKK